MKSEEKKQFIDRQLASMKKIINLQKQIKDIDKSLEELHPVTIAEDNTFYVFDLDAANENYELKLEYPVQMQIPKGILAAFPLDFYNMKPSAIVTEEVFKSLDGYVAVFHEFVHCYQAETCESELRETLEIERISKKENNIMWEINHQFPYEDSILIAKTNELNNYFNKSNYNNVINYYRDLKEHLNKIDYEYMMWQQWKEGFARYIENLINDRLGLNRNANKLEAPYDRVSFYDIGSRYIALLLEINSNLKGNIKDLYYKMYL